jgi:hypothetical protein
VLAWECLKEGYAAVLGRDDIVPGAIGGIQTFGALAHWHSHLHFIGTAGAFTPEGVFLPLPEKLETEPFRLLWERKLTEFLFNEDLLTEQAIRQMRTWHRSGFSVDMSVRIEAGDTRAIERLAQYMVRCPFSMERVISINPQGQVVYRAEKPGVFEYPVPGDPDLTAGISRNFEVFDPLDFIAQITQHIPPKGAQLIRYYGWYSNKARGVRAAAAAATSAGALQPALSGQGSAPGAGATALPDSAPPPSRRLARMRWAALIKRVYAVDPLRCPRCGGAMEMIAILTSRAQPEVVRKILEHCGLWSQPRTRPPPNPSRCRAVRQPQPKQQNLHYVPIDEFLAAL